MTMNINVPTERHARSRDDSRWEFNLYFTLIFLFAVPFATVDWLKHVKRRRTLNLRGPLARAWAEADRITPVIFSA
ncbi:cytochrome PufQ [Sedimentitalea arenosa]|jgi:hypothetical protein|uniref:Protein pufQ n=1 Tax=Sedimentitalea arenosa TaxID=2798803 RepID=A0A8J7IZ70_9RHOB|nr:cytochrome PufQ [Arenibacterium arenosum]MBJ6370105.1 protein pufQ [Arenibacterium arenosum]